MKESIKKVLKFSIYGFYEELRDKKKKKIQIKKQKRIIAEYLKNKGIKKLHIGCGSNIYDDWLNTDLKSGETVAFLDAGLKFPLENDSFDYIYSEHLFEHLNVSQQINMLLEGARILKKGGVMRIATPSLDFLFSLYNDSSSKKNSNYVNYSVDNIPFLETVKDKINDQTQHYCYVINNFFKAWGHQMIHNYSSLSKLALQLGYSDARICKVGESDIPDLKNIEMHGTIITEEMNLIETMVIEIIK